MSPGWPSLPFLLPHKATEGWHHNWNSHVLLSLKGVSPPLLFWTGVQYFTFSLMKYFFPFPRACLPPYLMRQTWKTLAQIVLLKLFKWTGKLILQILKLNPRPGLNLQTFEESISQFIWITGFQVTVTVTSNWKSLPNNFVQTWVERGLKPFGGVEIQPLKTNTFKIISLIEYLPWVALIMYELINMLWPCGVEVSEHLYSN